MTSFSTVTYDSHSQTAVVGAGLVWDDVYAALQPFNVSVVGGRVAGIGVAGFTLGGGIYPIRWSIYLLIFPVKDTHGRQINTD